jgi:hypothetical protein
VTGKHGVDTAKEISIAPRFRVSGDNSETDFVANDHAPAAPFSHSSSDVLGFRQNRVVW